jgi:hypothetical protein
LGRKPYVGKLELSILAVGDSDDTHVWVTLAESIDARGDHETIGRCCFASFLEGRVDLGSFGGFGGHICCGGRGMAMGMAMGTAMGTNGGFQAREIKK